MRLNKIKLSLIIFVFYAIASIAQTDTVYIEEILVTAKKTDNILKTNIFAADLELGSPQNIGEVLKSQTGFGGAKRGNYVTEPVLRGFKYSQINVQFDGGVHSNNACPNRMDPAISQISLEEIEKIEIIKGPYDVRFGPSFGGIINIISKRPVIKDGKSVSGTIDAGYQSNGNNYYSNLFAQLVSKKFDLSVSGGYKDYGNYLSGDGTEIWSSYRRWGYTIKAGTSIKENQRLQITFRQSSARDVLYAGLPMDADYDNTAIASVDYGATNISNTISSLKIKAYSSFIDHEMSTKKRPSYNMVKSVAPVEAQVFGGRSEIGLTTGSNNLFYAGIDYKQISKQGERSREVLTNPCDTSMHPNKTFYDKIWQDTRKNDLGMFVENKYQLSNLLVWLIGFRVDFASYAINDPTDSFKEQYNNEIQPDSKIALSITTSFTWYLQSDLNVQLAGAIANRTPDITELFINHLSIGMDAYEYLGNPNLKSETNYQMDVRVEKNWKNVSLFGDVFYSYLNNFITARLDTTIDKIYMSCKPPKGTKVFTNIETAYMTGFEAGVDISFAKSFTYSLGAAYTYAQNNTWDEPLPEIPPFTINTYLEYRHSKISTRLQARVASAQNRVSTSFNESTTEGFAVMDFYFTYKPWKFLDLNLAVTNLTDANYVEHLSRSYKNMGSETGDLFYERGRSFNLGVKFIF